jgi:hypothetical protein
MRTTKVLTADSQHQMRKTNRVLNKKIHMFYLLGFAIQHFNCRHYRVALSLSLPRGLITLAGYYGLSSLYEDEKYC